MLAFIRSVFDGSLATHPVRLTVVQSVIVTVLATLMSAGLYLVVGVHYPGVGYQIFAALLIASILAPVFLYPSFRVASQLLKANRTIREQAFTDQLTGLPNSFALAQELSRRISDRGGQVAPFAVHFLDVDRFKAVNTALGHETGDSIIVAIAAALRETIAADDLAARFGGDEFVVVQSAVTDPAEASIYAQRLISAVANTSVARGFEVTLSASAGTALAPEHGHTAAHLLKAANLALLDAREQGKPHALFVPSMEAAARVRRDTERGLEKALRNEELELLYQPIVSVRGKQRVVALEALMRWRHPDGTLVTPDFFIPVAESTGRIVEMGAWALRMACRQCAAWPSDTRVAVNVSAVQFQRSDFAETVAGALLEAGLAPGRLELEITESVLIKDIALVEPTLRRLRQAGVRVALDDFGSGYSGLNYLRRFMIDKIKVDKSIIAEAMIDEKAANILRGVAKIAAESGLTVTIEGVDTFEKADFIQREQCADEMQGFLFGQPAPATMVPLMLATDGGLGGDAERVVPLRR
jgi:diguanylate cyclase (GGDEF)-like protein